ncbi:ABC transporter ATP-binding protein [Fodinisporobacter ferrooxydans]|uniref:ABC transporter ATP-binding protein n=1 Tax=Fodinisporobacter ferrooxydans TaxID=2901836 RepID=A0ABY4CTQ1_9BACL|nr:ABC transporter ATP-binding protein [Alicyclobacillaceae bacterium MYW30-H2]
MIHLHGVTKFYKKKKIAGPLDMDVLQGESVALVGGNGAGKSTTLRVIAGLLKPSRGAAEIGGHPAGSKEAKQMLFYLPQKLMLPGHLTLNEALRFFSKLHNRPIADIQNLAAIYHLSDVTDDRIGTFSGGMMQRLGLLIADHVNTPILLLDEPTSNLDRQGIELFFEQMYAWRKNGRTIVFASHAAAEINELADRCVVMESGRVQEMYATTSAVSKRTEGFAHA